MATPSPSLIASDAMQYQGVPYAWAKANPNGWDCSGFVNWVLGHDLGMALPGSVKAGFSGKSHGPVVVQYATWTKATKVRSPEAGDLCIWYGLGAAGHIGIAVSPTQMISALNPALGTIVTDIQGTGPPSAPLTYRRVTGMGQAVGCIPGAGLIWMLSKRFSLT